MNKIFLIIGREYFTRVKKKSFLVTTILVPVIIIGFYVAIFAISMQDSNEVQQIAVIDEANIFNGYTDSSNPSLHFTLVKNETEKSFLKKYKPQGYGLFLYIPKINDSTAKNKFTLHSPSSVSLSTCRISKT